VGSVVNDCLSDRDDVPSLKFDQLRLLPLAPSQIPTLMSWFDSQAALWRWSPGATFPPDAAKFMQEARLEQVCSKALVDAQGVMLGFGQYSDRATCCHLSRLVVAPRWRGQGLGQLLITLLADEGTKALGLGRLSLFVNHDNTDALRLYLRLGFSATPFHDPAALRLAKAHYLTRSFP
jgi:ribosomal protein S18 acetylase RimI-like enzyme